MIWVFFLYFYVYFLDMNKKVLFCVHFRGHSTFASIMLQQGEEIAWVSMMLGHADIHTTLTKYARFIPRRDKKRAEFLENLDVDLKFG